MTKWYKNNLRLLMAQENLKRAQSGDTALTQSELSDATGVSRQTLNRWLDDRRPLLLASKVDRSTIDRLCKFFGVTKNELLEKVEEPEKLGAGA